MGGGSSNGTSPAITLMVENVDMERQFVDFRIVES